MVRGVGDGRVGDRGKQRGKGRMVRDDVGGRCGGVWMLRSRNRGA